MCHADVVKSRVQNAELPPKGANYILNTMRQMYRQEGAKAFIAGLTPSCACIHAYQSAHRLTPPLLQTSERAASPSSRAADPC